MFLQGNNCAMAVFGAFCEEAGIDPEIAMKLASPFGAGMGKTRNVCGALTGMLMAVGAVYGYTDPAEKGETFALSKKLLHAFKKKNGSLVCRTLLDLDENGEGEKGALPHTAESPCYTFVSDAAALLEREMKKPEK